MMCSIYLKLRACPIDLREAISSIIFASMRCADVTELADVRKHFTSKYGKEFAAAALEVRPDSGVNHLVCFAASGRLYLHERISLFLLAPNECRLLLLIWRAKRLIFWIWIQVIEKLSAGAPDIQTKIKTFTSIAEEHNIKWEPKAFEEKLQKPNEDLLVYNFFAVFFFADCILWL
jgi:hypothetical protein